MVQFPGMSAAESFQELTERLAREREFDAERPKPAESARPQVHQHETAIWRWDPDVAFWIGECACGATFLAAPWIAAKLERLAKEEADRLAGRGP